MSAAMDETTLIKKVFEDKYVQAQMIDLNQEQLQKGKEADGSSTGEYSEVSVSVYGKTPGPITLRESGYFYGSMKVRVGDREAYIEGDTIKTVRDYKDKGLTIDLTTRWPKALGLTNESIQEVRAIAKDVIIEDVHKAFAA